MSFEKPAQASDALTHARIIDIIQVGVACYRLGYGQGWNELGWPRMLRPIELALMRIPSVARLVISGQPTSETAHFLVTYDDGSECNFRVYTGDIAPYNMGKISVNLMK